LQPSLWRLTIKIDTLASFNRRRRMKAESRQIPQKLAARLKCVYCLCSVVASRSRSTEQLQELFAFRVVTFLKHKQNGSCSDATTSGGTIRHFMDYFRQTSNSKSRSCTSKHISIWYSN